MKTLFNDELDILREVCSIAACHGSIALSEILGKKINLELPALELISCLEGKKNIDFEKTGVGIFSKIIVGLQGDMVFLLDERNAFKLIDMSYRVKKSEKRPGVFTELGLSIIKEVGNIVTASYLNALSLMIQKIITPRPPTLISGSIEDIFSIVINAHDHSADIVLIKAHFCECETEMSGFFHLFLTPAAVEEIRMVCKEMLESPQE